MNWTLVAGVVLTALSLVGYAVGVVVPYPGRSFSVTAFMAGVSLAVIGRALEPRGDRV